MANNPLQLAPQQELDFFVQNYKIFVDTCSLMNTANTAFWADVALLLQRYKKQLIIAHKVVQELTKHQKSSDSRKATQAKNAMKVLVKLDKVGLLDKRGETTDTFADNTFLAQFTRHSIAHKLLLITQDRALAQDILNLNNTGSVNRKTIYVRRIDAGGLLRELNFSTKKSAASAPAPKPTPAPKSTPKPTPAQKNHATNPAPTPKPATKSAPKPAPVPPSEIFVLAKSVTTIPETQIRVSQIPAENSVVFGEGRRQISLKTEVGRGGEGAIYTTNRSGFVAKIYFADKNTRRKYEKIRLMISKKLSCAGICLPSELLFNAKNEFVGYLMPQARGKELDKSVFGPRPLFEKTFPNWTKRETVALCVTILQKIKYLHERNVILGDINGANILVVSPTEVYFVDTDSYQVEGFPCPAGKPAFTAPEIQGRAFERFLRTFANENFALATLLFRIMMAGKLPYSQQGGESITANIKAMDFSFPLGEKTNKKTPEGLWRFMWSHLPRYNVKEMFYNTFAKDGTFAAPATRPNVQAWLNEFRKYLVKDLSDGGDFLTKDSMSLQIFPNRYRKVPSLQYVRCIRCDVEKPTDFVRNGVCDECWRKASATSMRGGYTAKQTSTPNTSANFTQNNAWQNNAPFGANWAHSTSFTYSSNTPRPSRNAAGKSKGGRTGCLILVVILILMWLLGGD